MRVLAKVEIVSVVSQTFGAFFNRQLRGWRTNALRMYATTTMTNMSAKEQIVTGAKKLSLSKKSNTEEMVLLWCT